MTFSRDGFALKGVTLVEHPGQIAKNRTGRNVIARLTRER